MSHHLATTALAAWLLATASVAEPIITWPALEAPREGRGGLFAAWGADQRQVAEALLRLERADPDRELDALRRRVAEDPTDLATGDALAVRLWRTGQLPAAVAEFRRVLLLDPAYERSRLNLADLFREIGAPDRAIRELNDGIGLAPTSTRLRRCLADLCASRRRHRDAAEAWRQIAALKAEDPYPLINAAWELALNGQSAEAKAVLAKALEPAAGKPDALLALADVHRALGQFAAAQAIWDDVLRRQPNSGAAMAQLGLRHLRDREFARAGERFAQALDLPGADAAAFGGAVTAAHGRSDREGVIELTRRMRAAGHTRLVSALLANWWLSEGDANAVQAVWALLPAGSEEEQAAYQQLLSATKDSPDARRKLALLLSQAEVFRSAGWLNAAIEALEAARQLVPSSMAVGLALADCCAAAGDYSRELSLRQELAREAPDSVPACQGLVRAYLERRQWTQADEVNSEFIQRIFDEVESRITAATSAIRAGDYEAALNHCRAALRRHPLDERLYRLQLDALLRLGRPADAMLIVRNREGASPTFVPGPLERALLALTSGQLDEGLAHVHRGFRSTPRDHCLWLLAALLLEKKGDSAAAAVHCQVAGWLQPDCFSTQLAAARAAAQAGLPALGAEAYRAALDLREASPELRLEFADALTNWGRHAEARDLLATIAPANAAQRDAVNSRLAEAFLAQGQAHQALELAQSILSRDADDPVAQRVAVLACRDLGDLATAIKVCETADKAPGARRPDADLGLLYLLDLRYRDAEGRLADALASAAARARVGLRTMQAIACIAQGFNDRAMGALADAQDSLPPDERPREALILALGSTGADAGARALEILSRYDKPSAAMAAWLRSAMARFAANREVAGMALAACVANAQGWHTRSAELFMAALGRAPEEPWLLYKAAEAQGRARALDAAVALARKLAAADPKAGDAQLLLGSLLESQGASGEAAAAYARALPLMDRQAPGPLLLLAEHLGAVGKLDESIEAYRAVLDAKPDDRAACQRLAWLYAAHKPDRLAEAERLATRAASADPTDAASRDTLGWVLFLAKKPEAARGEVLAALARDPRNAQYYYHLGMIDFVRGSRAQARRALQAALRLDAKLADADTALTTLKTLDGAGASDDGFPMP